MRGYNGITLSVCPCVRSCPLNIFWTAHHLFFFFLPNCVWWCIRMRWCVMRGKKWFTIVNVNVTASAYIIKIWLFLLYLLNCWSVCNQTWFVRTASYAGASCGRNEITAFKVKVTAKVQIVSECLFEQYLLNHITFCYQTWYANAASWAGFSCRKKGSFIFKSKVTARAHQNVSLSTISSNCRFFANQTWSDVHHQNIPRYFIHPSRKLKLLFNLIY